MQDGARAKEQQALEQGVVHGMVETGGNAQRRGKAGGGQHIADLGDGVEGQQALEIMLGKGHRDTDEHADGAKEDQPELDRAEVHGPEQDIGETKNAVKAALRQNTGDEHRDRSRSRAVGVGSQRMEGHDEGLGAEADEQQRVGHHGGKVQVPRQEGRQLCEVQRVRLGVQHDGARQNAGGADAADHQVLEGRFQRAEDGVAESREGHRREGQNLHHDEHVEEVPGEDKAHNAAAEHQEEGVVLGLVVVMAHVAEAVEHGHENRRGNQQPEEEAHGVHFQRNADGVAAGGDAVAHPVGDDLILNQNGFCQ